MSKLFKFTCEGKQVHTQGYTHMDQVPIRVFKCQNHPFILNSAFFTHIYMHTTDIYWFIL